MAPKGISKDHYYVFLASPGDMTAEREHVREYFQKFNRSNALKKRVTFEILDWENWTTSGVGRPQQLILEQTVEEYKEALVLVVGLMGSKFGSPTGQADSGTDEEFRWAVKRWREAGWPEIKWFFKKARRFETNDPKELIKAAEQLEKVQEFQKDLREGDPTLLYKEFDDTPDFAGVFGQDLDLWLNDPKRPWSQHTPPKPPEPQTLVPDLAHPYPLPPNFTGRVAERRMLTGWFTSGSRPVCVVEAIGGMGKSALSWYWLHADVLGTPPAGYAKADPAELRVPEEQRPEGVLFWSFYESDADFGAFLSRAVEYVGARHASPEKLSDRERLEILLNALAQRRILLILDGFERELRAYAGYRAPYQGDETVQDGGNDCCDPRAAMFLQYAASLPLAAGVLITSRLLPNELLNLAGCQHEPLESLSREDVVNFFEASRVKGTRAEIAQAVAPYGGHPLSVSLLARAIVEDPEMKGDIRVAGEYTVLNQLKGKSGHDILEVAYNQTSAERRELLSRIAAFRSPMDYEAIKAVAALKPASLKPAIAELVKRGLLFREDERYDLHPIVRQYAYDRLSDKEGVHSRLQEYFEARPTPERVESLEDLTPTIELYWHMVGAGRFDAAFKLFRDRLAEPLYFRFGAYERRIELLGALFPEGEDRSPKLSKESDQAWTLNGLANSYSLAGQPRRAVPLFEMDIAILEKLGDTRTLPTPLGNLADDQMKLGRLLAYEGRFAEAERELSFKDGTVGSHKSVQTAYWALLNVLQSNFASSLRYSSEALAAAGEAQFEAQAVWALWLLGWAHTALDDRANAERHLNEALTRCRRINMVDHEPSILLALARLNRDRETALKALTIADRCEFRLDQADIHNLLAQLALDEGKPGEAREQAQKAKGYAYCDGPPHYYKPAYEEAERLLAEAGES